jgi:uncharacterized membrane protein YoaK (UPF0700 family)
MQFASFKTFEGIPYSPFMYTGNMRSGMEAFLEYLKTKEGKTRQKASKYYKILLLFLSGAIFGGIVIPRWGIYAILANGLLMAITLVIIEEEKVEPHP